MDWKERVRDAFAARGAVPDEDVVEELAMHAADSYQTARADGQDAGEAERLVLGHVAAWTRDPTLRDRRPHRVSPLAPPPAADSSPLAGVGGELRYAARLLARQPGHALLAILTMALGIGATTLLFSVLYGVLLKPLPWPAGDRLVRLSESRKGGTNRLGAILTNATYHAQAGATSIEALAAWSASPATMTDAGAPERIRVGSVSASLFPLLAAQPRTGRLFTAADEAPGHDGQVVLSHGLWQQRFGGRTDAIGRTLRLDGRPYRIVAVMPASFAFPDRETRAWIPFRVPRVETGSLSMFGAIARLRSGVSPSQAAAEATTRARRGADPGMVAIAVFGSRGPVEVAVVPLLDAQTREVRPAILVFLVAVGLLLATATGNVASLQLARASARRRELAIRSALGAGTARLVRQFLAESVLLGLAGGLAGVVLAAWLLRALPALLPANFPRLDDIALNVPVLLFACAVSLLTGLVFGVLPARHARRINVVESLNEDSLAPVGISLRSPVARARTLIMGSQVAIACVLLVNAVLLSRSFFALVHADRGYDPVNVLTAALPLPDSSYTGPRRSALITEVLARLRALPEVREAGFTTTLPLVRGEMLGGFAMKSRHGTGMVSVQAGLRHVSPRYFAALGLRLVEGKGFAETDSATSQPVVVVNRAFVQQYLGERAVGERLPSAFSAAGDEAEVIGIVEDVRQRAVTDAVQPEMYVSYRQLKDGVLHHEPMLVVRTAGDPTRLVPALRDIVRAQDGTLALGEVRTMQDRVSGSLAQPRLYAVLLGGFAVFALAIAGVGLFGVLAYTVAQRSREIGVRTALGARPRDIVTLVLRQGLAIAFGGLAVGLMVASAGMQYLTTFLYGVDAYDPLSYLAVCAALLVVAGAACYVPARRAARVDPLRALRT